MADENNKTQAFFENEETVLQSEAVLRGGSNAEVFPYLIIVQGPHQGLKFPLKQGDNLIGRVMGSEITLEDQSVSRKHAVVSSAGDGLTVEDLGSKNGTFVNAQKLTERVTVGHGDVIQAGIYALRLITRPVPKEEVEKPLPPDWEGRTIMTGIKEDDETATVAEVAKEVMEEESISQVTGRDITSPELDAGENENISSAEDSGKKKLPIWLVAIIAVVGLAVIGSIGAFAYFKFFKASPLVKSGPPASEMIQPPPPATTLPSAEGIEQPVGVPPTETPPGEIPPAGLQELQKPTNIPLFLDFASSPLPATVKFEGQDYGSTPVKVQAKLDIGKVYTASAVFDLTEIGEKYSDEVSFTVNSDDSLVPVLFKGPIGVIKVIELPRDVELYLEGYFIYDPFNAKTAKLSNMIFGKPVYVPYGKYVVELRKGEQMIGSGEFSQEIKYRREILVSEDSPVFEIKITEEDLKVFPVEILSVPTNSAVFIDAQKVGVTPYKGIFPLGDHTVSLRKEGYFENKQDFRMDKNVPVKMEVELKTTETGEYINVGKLLMQKGQYQEAVAKLTEGFKHTPSEGETAQIRYLLGSCFIFLGDMTSAEDYFKQSQQNEEMKYPSQLGLVSVYNGLGRRDEAIPLLVDVLLNSKDEVVLKEAKDLFQKVSPLRSIIYIYSDPAGARVIMNDKQVPEVTPLILPDLSLGSYKLRIEKDGYIPQDLNINISVNEFNPVIVQLKPIPK